MTTIQKKVASHLAKALLELDWADWNARDNPAMHKQICSVRSQVSKLFTSTGYEFGAGSGARVRIRKA